MRRLVVPLVAALLLPGASALAAPPVVFHASYTAVPPTSVAAASAFVLPVTLGNVGPDLWPTSGPQPVNLSYHWIDAGGSTVVWDGVRTPLGAPDVAPGAQRQVQATVQAPPNPGSYFLLLALVQEGVGWVAPSAPSQMSVITGYQATFGQVTLPTFLTGATYQISVPVTNTGTVSWPAQPSPQGAVAASPVELSYHLRDAAGNAIVWDGPRTPLTADVAPGASATFSLSYVAPSKEGTYTLVIDLVREGVSWFQFLGSQPFRQTVSVTSGLMAGYGLTTTPQQATIGATLQLTVQVSNYGQRTWMPGAFSLSYHIFRNGETVVWDGARGILPAIVPPAATVTVPINVALPGGTGDYVIAWDMVQEGVAWFSQLGVVRKQEPFAIVPGVTFFGSGFGHGLAMSQYGGDGWATGATGIALTGEQIVLKY